MNWKVLVVSLMMVIGVNALYAKGPKKVYVIQDAFVQGGDNADERMGVNKDGELRIMKSDGDDKYSRTSYLLFNLKKVEDFSSARLHLCMKVYESKDDANAEFELQVYSGDGKKWSESTLTYSNKPGIDQLLATQTYKPSEKNVWVSADIDVEKLKKAIKASKNGKVTLVLYNKNFNRTSAIVLSKERAWSNGNLAKREVYLELK